RGAQLRRGAVRRGGARRVRLALARAAEELAPDAPGAALGEVGARDARLAARAAERDLARERDRDARAFGVLGRGFLALGAALGRGARGQDLATAVAPACALGLGLERGVLGAEDAVALAEPSLARANVGLGELARAALGCAGEGLNYDLELLARGH